MSLQSELLESGTPAPQRPWPRAVVTKDAWRRCIRELAAGNATLLGYWSDGEAVHMALIEPEAAEPQPFTPFVVSLPCPDGRYPSVAGAHPPALRLERAIHDLHGLTPVGLPDARPWLDHGRWGRHPLGARQEAPADGLGYTFLPVEGPPMHEIAVGPVHAGIIEPGHFRFTASGETVVRLEQRLGFTHKGTESLMAGATVERAARLAGRVSGDSTVAYALAFAMAVESATGLEAPPRAVWLRAVMAELERLANHLGDIGAICNDAAFALLHAHCGALRERVLRAAAVSFGHRLMMDRVVPGGVACDLDDGGAAAISSLIADMRRHFPELVELYENTTSLQDRTVTTGTLDPGLARRYGAGGYVGRATGRTFDARRWPGYPPYPELAFEVPVRSEGDVDARVWIRIHEVYQSLALLEQCLARLPRGRVLSGKIVAGPGEGVSLVEGFRGDILAWVRVAGDGAIARCHLRDPSWFQWPLLEAVVEGNIVADFPLINKSFNCSYSGHDL
ncbi:MAG: NADH-quinone oxidoreductase subunit C [Hyphomicrobiaceae bacterium]|nr:NADH-quinone oxidoreductase subunit C [Hyphomicrobiaceae bacterium]